MQVFADAVLAWFDCAGRKHLPWQQQPTPYRVWVSEIMLQQTQVNTVIPYYERFMAALPTVQALAGAHIDQVLHLWTGLGYYARARNLQRAAQIIVDEHGGEFPREFKAVEALPGIGRSTAGAILALSCGQRHPILDGNVKRVLARHAGIAGYPGEPAVAARLWELADRYTPHVRVAAYTQAMMDLGATVCVRSKPNCAVCPVSDDCVARAHGTQSQLPTPRPAKIRPARVAHLVIAMRADGAVLIERRPPAGIWGGLWVFPQFDTREAAAEWLAGRAADGQAAKVPLSSFRHSFTHFDLDLHPMLVRGEFLPHAIGDDARYQWYDPRQPAQVGLAAPTVALLASLSQGAQYEFTSGLASTEALR